MDLFRTRKSAYTIQVIAHAQGRTGEDIIIASVTVERLALLPAGRLEYDDQIGRVATHAIRRHERKRGNTGDPTLTADEQAIEDLLPEVQ